VKVKVSINEFQDPTEQLALARNQLIANDKRRADLTAVLYAIRASVGIANAENGANSVSAKLARAAYIDKRIGQLKVLVESDVVESDAVINGKLDKFRNSKDDRSRIYGYSDTVDTGVLTQEQIDQFKTELSLLRKEKQKLNDEVLELNIRTEVTLTDKSAVEILRAEQLI
jgi:hypothetical protein